MKKNIMKIRFKRQSKITGLAAVAFNNDVRSYYALIGDECIGFISNVSAHALSGDNSYEWKIWLSGAPGHGNICLKRRFKRDDIEQAKEYFRKIYEDIMTNPVHAVVKSKIRNIA